MLMTIEQPPQLIRIDYDTADDEWVVDVRGGIRYPESSTRKKSSGLEGAVGLALWEGRLSGGMIEINHPDGHIEEIEIDDGLSDFSDHPPGLLAD